MRRGIRTGIVIGLAAAACAVPAPPAAGDTANAASGARCPLPVFGPGAAYRPVFRPAAHTALISNPWFPLHRGTTWIYTGIEGGRPAVDVVVASRHVKMIDGVRTRVVRDRLYHGAVLVERTSDYYAQDRCGNVWYFGEDTAEVDPAGHVVSRDGTWRAGVGGAQPGVIMQAHPQLGRSFRQEWLEGEAEDVFQVVDRNASVSTVHHRYRHALRTRETTALEPGVVDAKF